ncbi:hypothetical protein NEOLEDRAFT_600540 [Neolentinus lepideus HHB14362 ss-1]|uniref:DUF6533 domain-containing protein n=1 Tax=Neolentinus lepideus HHB14362 ss-1 TaxID=1314782 RepID=A0A165VB76_9AGAM|nr:hypothetical protein NEOLEDRAFT_600540 [Neolentinus lepideus HHB14362 ss-1]
MSLGVIAGQTLFDQYLQFVHDIYVVNLFTAAAAMWLLYDTVLTFPREVSHVWRANWTFSKVLYIILRYICVITMIFYVSVGPSTGFPSSVTAFLGQSIRGDAMLGLRVRALYHGNKNVIVLVTLEYFVTFVTDIVAAVKLANSVHPIPGISDTLPGCTYGTFEANILYLIWIPGLTLSFLALSTLIRTSSLDNRTPFPRLAPLSYLLARDGVMYYCMYLVVSVSSMVIMLVFPGRELAAISEVLAPPVYAIGGCRLYLNLRDADEVMNLGTSKSGDIELKQQSGLVFAHTSSSALANSHSLSTL